MPVRLNSQRKGVSITWDEVGEDYAENVTVYATGEEGDVHNKASQVNSGEAGLFYPADFVGTSDIEVRNSNGVVVSSGTIEIT